MTSDSVDHMTDFPKSMVIVGAGVIGCEYACTFAALGVEVLLVNGRDQLLTFLDEEIQNVKTKEISQVGMKLMKFCAKWDLQRVSEQAQLYAEPLNARYKQ